MKTLLSVLFSFVFASAIGQTNDYQLLLDSAKTLCKSSVDLDRDELDKFDFTKVVSLLEQAITLQPDSSEARYFLAYTYSRINSVDGRGIIDMDLDLVYKCSEQLEKVIELTPEYKGELLILDPYGKLTSEWGSMALCYLYNQKSDSAIWAFKEGKKRFGFGDYTLAVCRQILDTCDEHSILITSGDSFTFPLLYLQFAENYRTDVSVVDVNLLNTSWYPSYLSKNEVVTFDMPDEMLDTIEYVQWPDVEVTIAKFTWTIKATYYEQYLLRGDRVFLSLLEGNEFKRKIYFTKGFIENNRLSLGEYLNSLVISDKLSIPKKVDSGFEDYKIAVTKILKLSDLVNPNSRDERRLLDLFRFNLIYDINDYLTNGEKEKADEAMEMLERLANLQKFPFSNNEVNEFLDQLKQKMIEK